MSPAMSAGVRPIKIPAVQRALGFLSCANHFSLEFRGMEATFEFRMLTERKATFNTLPTDLTALRATLSFCMGKEETKDDAKI